MKSIVKLSYRTARYAALAAAISVAACTDTTSPDAVPADVPVDAKAVPNPAVTSLGPWISDATSWVFPSMVDPVDRGKLQSSINALAGHLTANNTTQIIRDIATIRGLINGTSTKEYIELGPIEVALCTIEAAMGI